jgi:hypothetical protein
MPSHHDYGIDNETYCGGTPDDDLPVVRWCDACQARVESDQWRNVVQDGVCRQLCHRHFQE